MYVHLSVKWKCLVNIVYFTQNRWLLFLHFVSRSFKSYHSALDRSMFSFQCVCISFDSCSYQNSRLIQCQMWIAIERTRPIDIKRRKNLNQKTTYFSFLSGCDCAFVFISSTSTRSPRRNVSVPGPSPS